MLNFQDYSIKNYFRKKKEQGASVIIAALSLPILMAGGVAAVDVGSYFSHAAELQNAADAAALAGAAAFVSNRESVGSHPNADEEAGRYIGINLHNDETKDYSTYTHDAPKFAAKEQLATNDDKYNAQIYYGVKLTDTSPSYFAKFFKLDDPKVEVTAVAQIKASKHDPANTITDLFIFKEGMSIPNTINNPDYFNDAEKANYATGPFYSNRQMTDRFGLVRGVPNTNPIISTFDGHMSYTSDYLTQKNWDGTPMMDSISSSTQVPHAPFYTSLGQEALAKGWVTIEDIYQHAVGVADCYGEVIKSDDYACEFNSEGKNTSSQGYWTMPELTDYNMEDEFVGMVAKKAKDYQSYYLDGTNGTPNKYLSVTDNSTIFSGDGVITVAANPGNGDGNMSLTLDGSLPGADDPDLQNSPMFIYFDETVFNLNINITASNKRPLIICAANAGDVKLEFTGNGDPNDESNPEFRGIICAPNATMHSNIMGGRVTGTLMGKSLKLEGGAGKYTYQNFGLGGDGKGSTESVDLDFDSAITMVSSTGIFGSGDWH